MVAISDWNESCDPENEKMRNTIALETFGMVVTKLKLISDSGFQNKLLPAQQLLMCVHKHLNPARLVGIKFVKKTVKKVKH